MMIRSFRKSLSALDICALYGIAATAWIVLSGYLSTYISADPATLARIEMGKGLAFVAVTTGLLYLALRRSSVDLAEVNSRRGLLFEGWRILVVICALVLLVPLVGYSVYRLSVPTEESSIYNDLRAIAKLQSQNVALWEGERRADLRALAVSPAFVDAVAALRTTGEQAAGTRLGQYFGELSSPDGYEQVTLLNPALETRVNIGPDEPAGPPSEELLAAIRRSPDSPGQVLYLEESARRLRQDFFHPVLDERGQLLAYLVASTAPHRGIYAQLGDLGFHYPTLETLLIRVENQRVVTQHISQVESGLPPLRLEPVANDRLAQVVSTAGGSTGSKMTIDHHGNEVLAVYAPSPAPGWQLVAKVDREEALAPARQLAKALTAVVLFALMTVIGMLVVLWVQQRRLYRLALLAREAEAEQRFREQVQASERFALNTIDSLPGHISVLDETGTLIATNSRWREFGLAQGGSLRRLDVGINYLEVCRRAAIEGKDRDAAAVLEGLNAVLEERREDFYHEYPCYTPESEMWFAVHLTRFPENGELRVVAFHEDITSRRQAEDRLRRINRYYSALSAMNSALIRTRDPAAMIREVCRIAATHTELRLVAVRGIAQGRLTAPYNVQGPAAGLFDDPMFDELELDIEQAHLPGAQAVRERRSVVLNDFSDHPLLDRLGPTVERYGIHSALICPIIRREGTWGVLEFFAGTENYFSGDLVHLLEEISADLAYSLDMIEVEENRRAIEADLLLHAQILKSTHEGLFITDHDNRITMVNPSMCEITGYREQELLGHDPRILQSGHQEETFYRDLWHTLNDSGRWEGEIWDRRKDGEVFPAWLSITRVDEGPADGHHHIAIYRDITERKKYESYIEHLATHDILTDLPNRSVLQERLHLMIAQADREGSQLALLFIDLDQFKLINDTLGHEVGDQLLKHIGNRIVEKLRDSDSVCRIGGDEFVAMLSNVRMKEDVAVVAEKILREIARPCRVEGHELVVTASIGIAMYPDHGKDTTGLMHIADVAMMAAKRSGQDRYHFYAGELGEDAREHLAMLNDLRGALDREELFLCFQPQLELQSRRVIGCEALVRWQHPERGLVSPGRFIPIAEDSGLIIPMGRWILREACRIAQDWRQRRALDIPVSVNVSVLQFRQDDFVASVEAVLNDTGLPPEYLELEVTESLLIVNVEQSLKKVKQLHAMGIQVAIDDFGTGYSSMAYLRQLAPHRLKIDKSFVDDVPRDSNAVSIVQAIVSLAGAVGIETIAEGVETSEQAGFLHSIWCSQAQGFLYSKPLPAEDFETWVTEWRSQK